MQEITSPTSVPAKTGTQPIPSTDSSGRPIAYTGNTGVVAQSGSTSAVARSGNMQTATMRTSTPVSTSYRSSAPVTAATTKRAQSSTSLDRFQAVQSGSPAEAMQQTVSDAAVVCSGGQSASSSCKARGFAVGATSCWNCINAPLCHLPIAVILHPIYVLLYYQITGLSPSSVVDKLVTIHVVHSLLHCAIQCFMMLITVALARFTVSLP